MSKTILVHFQAPTANEIRKLEGRLKLTLPLFYQQFLLDFPSALIETRTDLRWKHESISDRQLRMNIDELIYLNEYVRFPGVPWTENDGPWPDQFFVIGDDQCGNYWAFDRTYDNQAIWFYDHDEGKLQKQHETIVDFANHLVRTTNEFNAERRAKSDQ